MKAELVNNDNDTSSKMFEEPPTQEEEAIIEDTIIMEGLSPIVADNNGINEIFLQLRKDDVTEDSSEGLPPLLADDDDDDGDDNHHDSVIATNNCINETVKPPSESSIVNNPSQQCFGPCGSKDCKPPQQWEVCSNSNNSFINCNNVIGEKCSKKYGGLCRICIIAGGTTTQR